MTDPRLNSIHLETTRRQDFRAAREALLNGRGQRTLSADGQAAPANAAEDFAPGQPAESVDAVTAKFVLIDKEFVYPLKLGLNTIGRMPDNDVVIDDGYISRRHCAIVVHSDDRCELQDVASKNGTLLNGEKILAPTCLKHGDEMRLCTRNLVFMSRAVESTPPAIQKTQVQ